VWLAVLDVRVTGRAGWVGWQCRMGGLTRSSVSAAVGGGVGVGTGSESVGVGVSVSVGVVFPVRLLKVGERERPDDARLPLYRGCPWGTHDETSRRLGPPGPNLA
jgi:hypothetical protein